MTKHLNSSLNLSNIRSIFRWFFIKWEINLLLNHGSKHIPREIKIDRPRSTCSCSFHSFLYMIRYIFCISYSSTVFNIGFYEVNLIYLLKSLFWWLVEIIWSTDEYHWPTISPSICNTTDSICMARSWDTETDTWYSSKVASITSWIASLLFISKSIVIDSCSLYTKAKFDNRYSFIRWNLPTIP